LHLSLWIDGQPCLIDPGTGAYYGDLAVRNLLSERASHNGPDVAECPFAVRQGPFLWAAQHPDPILASPQDNEAIASISLHQHVFSRRVTALDAKGWLIQDSIQASSKELRAACHWIFAPGWEIHPAGEKPHQWEAFCGNIKLIIEFFPDPGQSLPLRTAKYEAPCSPHFREVLKTQAIRMEIEGTETANYTIKITCS
jgi:hypothetical protein